MEKKVPSGLFIAFSALLMVFSIGAVTSPAQSHDVAIAVGTPVVTQINCGEQAGGGEPYNATIKLLEFVRGPEALKRLQAAGGSNPAPKAGYEYILARISFQMKPRGAPGDKTFDLARPLQFSVFSTDLATEYEAPSVVLPKPELKRRVAANEPAEGWIAFEIKQGDNKPLMLFDPSSGSAWSRGKSHFFKLYQ
jgi:hypothetical protein